MTPAGFLADYETVDERISKFWADHPMGRIETEIIGTLESYYIKAFVYRDISEDKPAATGMATPDPSKKSWQVEDCETSAIGRALANLNYAAKGKRASQEEMKKVQAESTATSPTAGEPPPTSSPNHGTGEPQPEHISKGIEQFWTDFAQTVGFPKGRLLKQARSFPEGKGVLALEELSADHPAAKKVIQWAEKLAAQAKEELAKT